MITENYIKMCEQAPKELWDKVNHIGTLMVWRSFKGILIPCPKRKKLKGLAGFIPETLVTRTWLKDNEDIRVLKINQIYPGLNGDKGTPIYSLEQLWKIIKEQHFTENEADMITDLTITNDLKKGIYRVSTYADIDDIIYTRKVEGETLKECFLKLIMIEYSKVWTGEKWEVMK